MAESCGHLSKPQQRPLALCRLSDIIKIKKGDYSALRMVKPFFLTLAPKCQKDFWQVC
jgi:hypothetical protein